MMRILIVFAFLFGFLNENFSQYLEKEADVISRFRPGAGWYYSGNKPYEKGKLRKYDRLILDVVYNDWYGDREAFSSPWNSLGFNIAIFSQRVITQANTMSFAYGLSFSHYNNSSSFDLEKNTNQGTTNISNTVFGSDVISNKFTANYLEIPLELRFRTKGYKHFKWMIGGKIGYQMNAFTKLRFEEEGVKYMTKNYNFPDNNRLRYGATVRMGIRNVSLYGAFFFSELFTADESVRLTPLSLGLSFSFF